MGYDFTAIENKWQKYWDEHKTFHAENDYSKPKFYALVEFPYPSGQGLHIGHRYGYRIQKTQTPGLQRAVPDGLGRFRSAD